MQRLAAETEAFNKNPEIWTYCFESGNNKEKEEAIGEKGRRRERREESYYFFGPDYIPETF